MTDSWFEIPDERGALAIVISGDVKDKTFYAADLKQTLETTFWDTDLPLTRQYRLAPGTYKVILPESLNTAMRSVEVDVKEKQLSVLDISTESGLVATFQYDQKSDIVFHSLISKFYDQGSEKVIWPIELSPDSNIIRMDVDLPWPIKPPKP